MPAGIMRAKWLHLPLSFYILLLRSTARGTDDGGQGVCCICFHFVFASLSCLVGVILIFIECPDSLGYIVGHTQSFLLSLSHPFNFVFLFICFCFALRQGLIMYPWLS